MVLDRPWIPNLELGDAQIKWGFSNFAGREDTFNEAGQHNFQVILPPEMVPELLKQGWNIKTRDALEEGDPPENLLKVNISYRFEAPRVYFLRDTPQGKKRIAIDDPSDLSEITRQSAEQIDVIIKPVPWAKNGSSGVSAYVEEMYVNMKSNRFADAYADYEPIR